MFVYDALYAAWQKMPPAAYEQLLTAREEAA